MKKLLLILTCMALMAAPAFASPSGNDGIGAGHNQPGQGADDNRDDDDTPTRPVPEPGTMALASMGLIALGAAARKRIGK